MPGPRFRRTPAEVAAPRPRNDFSRGGLGIGVGELLPAPTWPRPGREQLAEDIAAAVAALALPADGTTDRWTVRAATAAWLAARRSAHTRRAYVRDLAGWLSWLHQHDLDPRQARRGDVDTWLAQLTAATTGRRPPAASTVHRRLSALSSWYGYLAEHDLVARNPVTTVDRPALDRDFSPTVGLSVAEVRALLHAADADVDRRTGRPDWPGRDLAVARRNRILVGLLAHLGLRVAEATGLNLSDLRHHAGHRTVVVRGKRGRTRALPLPPRLARLIDEHVPKQQADLDDAVRSRRVHLDRLVQQGAAPPDLRDTETSEQYARRHVGDPLLSTYSRVLGVTDGRRLTQAYAHALIRRLARAAGIPAAERISPHSLRHAAATAALNRGAPLRDVQEFLGHADPRTTRRYDNRGSLDRSPAYRLGVLYAAE